MGVRAIAAVASAAVLVGFAESSPGDGVDAAAAASSAAFTSSMPSGGALTGGDPATGGGGGGRVIQEADADGEGGSDEFGGRGGDDGDYLFPDGKVKADGACPLMLLLPFTTGGEELSQESSWAFSHLSAAVMAMEHFNNRSGSVVPELATDPLLRNCSVYFPLDDTDAADTESMPKRVSDFIMNFPKAQSRCAILGPYNDEPALEAGVISYGLNVPVISHGSEDNQFALEDVYPNVFRTCVHNHAIADLAISALRSKGRTDFLNVLYVSQESSIQLSESLNNAANEQGFSQVHNHKIARPYVGMEPGRSVWYAMQNIQKNTFRTIFVAIHEAKEQLPFVADAAEEYGLNSAEYVWMFSGSTLDIDWALYGNDNANITKLLKGAAFMRQMDGFDVDPEGDRFLGAWKSRDSATVDQVRAFNPIREGEPGYYDPPADYFQKVSPFRGSGFMYDAVIAQGMGACWAEADFRSGRGSGDKGDEPEGDPGAKGEASGMEQGDEEGTESDKSNIMAGNGRRGQRLRPSSGGRSPASTKVLPDRLDSQGRRLQKPPPPMIYPRMPNMVGISEIEFTGATGKVKFKESKRYYKNRDRNLFAYGLYNVQEVQGDEGSSFKYVLTDTLTEGGAEEGVWKETNNGPFIFATGTAEPPTLLRAVPEQNYLSRGSRVTGLLFMSISLATIAAAVIFVALKAKHAVVRGAQPPFLYAFCFGATTMSMSIFTLSWDESYGWNADMLTVACQTTPWLVVLGHVIIYCSIFSKLHRINQVLQFRRRRKVNIKQVLGPFVAMIISAIIVLSVWTAIDPLTWDRQTINDFTGETYGACRSDHSLAFLIPLACIMVLSTVLAAIMAWKTKDVQARFSESGWIFYTIFVQLQTLLVGIPVIVILTDESTNAAYLGRVLVIWTIPMTTMLLLIGPKAIQVLFPKQENSRNKTRGVGAAPGGVAVSGITPSAAQSLFPSNSSVISNISNQRESMSQVNQRYKSGMATSATSFSNPSKQSSVKFQIDEKNDQPQEEVIQEGYDGKANKGGLDHEHQHAKGEQCPSKAAQSDIGEALHPSPTKGDDEVSKEELQ